MARFPIHRRDLIAALALAPLFTGQAMAQALTSTVGFKFDAHGQAIPCPGNTIVSALAPNSPEHAMAAGFRARLASQPFASKFAILPADSYHMTVFDGVMDIERRRENWPSDLPVDATLTACDREFLERLKGFNLECAPPFKMRPAAKFDLAPHVGLQLWLEPADDVENARLRRLRDRLADVLKLRHPDHDRYRFHITIAYLIQELTDDEATAFRRMRAESFAEARQSGRVLEIGRPAFCLFDDMLQYRPQLYLKD